MKHKKLIIILLAIFFALIFFIALTAKPKPNSNQPVNSSSQQTTGFNDLINQPASSEETKPFFLNYVETLRNTNGYSWLKNQLIYSVPEGIYSADSNQPLVKTKVDQISWNSQAQAVFSDNQQWFFFDSTNKEIKPLSITGSVAKLHPSKPFVAILNDSVLNIYSLTDLTQPIFTVNSSVDNFFWALDLPIIAFQTDRIETFNLSRQEKQFISLPENSELTGISPNGEMINLYDSSSQNLLLLDKSGKELKTINLPEAKSLTINWLDEQTFIALGTSAPDSLGRITDFIWLINLDGKKKFLSGSQPIINKLNPIIPIYPNADKNVIGLVENNGPVWILGLVPGFLPNYSNSNIYNYPMQENDEGL